MKYLLHYKYYKMRGHDRRETHERGVVRANH